MVVSSLGAPDGFTPRARHLPDHVVTTPAALDARLLEAGVLVVEVRAAGT